MSTVRICHRGAASGGWESDGIVTEEGGRILVVEDDPMVSEVVDRYLTQAGFTVDVVGDGLVALEHAQRSSPDLVVLDIMLPGMDGLEVCRRLRERAPIPVIMLTALGQESDKVMGLELGADDYVAKPFSPRASSRFCGERVLPWRMRATTSAAPSCPEIWRSMWRRTRSRSPALR